MEMIIGGAYQGKAAYAKAQFPDVDWKFGGEITEEELLKAAGVLGFQEYHKKSSEGRRRSHRPGRKAGTAGSGCDPCQ